jgi:hypothetical protein
MDFLHVGDWPNTSNYWSDYQGISWSPVQASGSAGAYFWTSGIYIAGNPLGWRTSLWELKAAGS